MNLEQFIKQAKGIKLNKNEKTEIIQSILNFISQNSVRSEIKPRLTYGSNIFLTKFNFSSAMAILLIISVLVGGGVAVGAERALPGDALYQVKVDFNEEVRGWLSVSEEARANWEVERAERRLEEAEELAAEGSLDAEARAGLEARFDAHAEKIKSRIDRFETKENFNAAVDVSSKFETSLRAHEKILNRLEAEAGASQELKPIRVRVRSQVDKTRKNREGMELKAEGHINIEGQDEDDRVLEINSESQVESRADSVNNGTNIRVNVGL